MARIHRDVPVFLLLTAGGEELAKPWLSHDSRGFTNWPQQLRGFPPGTLIYVSGSPLQWLEVSDPRLANLGEFFAALDS